MSNKSEQEVVRIQLTREQKDKLRLQTGKEADTIELTVHELEERIAPGWMGNHNETFVLD